MANADARYQIAPVENEERQLSDRERTVLLLAAEGLTDKEIAKHLSLSQRTIGTYWERMRQKLGPFSRTQLVARFLRLEAELERSSESYVNVFAGWDEGVWIVASTGKTIYANAPVAALLNIPIEELTRSDGPALLESVIGERARDFLREASVKATRLEVQLTLENGGTKWLSLRASPVCDRRGQSSATVVIVQDHTFQKRVRQTLDMCRQSLDTISELSSDLIVRFDSEFLCIFANRAFRDRHKISAVDLANQRISELKMFEPTKEWEAAIHLALESGIATKVGQTHIVAEPSHELQPSSVLCITPP
ncbi:MAG: LuxR C-terminal-related transcriptional regulator [Fimbriimonas sp.]